MQFFYSILCSSFIHLLFTLFIRCVPTRRTVNFTADINVLALVLEEYEDKQ